jgi:hypothetical protein
MNEGVKILLERIKTNPEEFYDEATGLHVTTRWGRILTDYQSFLEPEDKDALKEAMNKLHQEQFTKRVMKELLAPEEDNSLGKPWYTGSASGTVSATPIPAISSITLSRKEQINAMKVEVRKKATLKKEHQTLFGKLFNYS